MDQPRKFNVLITGTPGTGKTTMGKMLAQELGLQHIEVGAVIREHEFFTSYNEEFDTLDVEEDDEDRLLDHLEPLMVRGGVALDYHSCELFPKRWFHLVLVLRASTESVFDRLKARNYSQKKIDENNEAEIMGECEDEARESYDESVVVARENNTVDEMMATVEFIAEAMDSFAAPPADDDE